MPDEIATIRLPEGEFQEGYLQALSERSHFRVESIGGDLAIVCPSEGPGRRFEYFKKTKLCDAITDLKDPNTWSAIRDAPPRARGDVDPRHHRDEMLEQAEVVQDRSDDLQSQIYAFSLVAQGAVQTDELEELLETSLVGLFEAFPEGELWYVTTDDLLLARLMLANNQLSLQLTPDIPLGPHAERHDAFSDLTLTKGIDFSPIIQFPLMALSPSVLGFTTPVLPQMLVFTFGTALELRRFVPFSLPSIFRPGVLGSPEGADRGEFLAEAQESDGRDLLDWWIDRANAIYSHLADPTRFTDRAGRFDAAEQSEWMVTVERLMADSISLLAEPQATDLDRVQIAFDLIDKAETLIGYEYAGGAGFKALLKKEQCVRRIRESVEDMPNALGDRIGDEAELLFDDLYGTVLSNTAQSRFTTSGRGIRVVKESAEGDFEGLDHETFVTRLLRAIRNSSHGFIGTLSRPGERHLLAINSCGVPPSLSSLAPLIAVSLFADIDRVIDKSWKPRLVSQPETTQDSTDCGE